MKECRRCNLISDLVFYGYCIDCAKIIPVSKVEIDDNGIVIVDGVKK